jgi:hypothetical protein
VRRDNQALADRALEVGVQQRDHGLERCGVADMRGAWAGGSLRSLCVATALPRSLARQRAGG